jgi:hypothetical protein
MSLSSANLVGYLRAEFDKAAKIRTWLLIVQLLAALPAAISVWVPDHDKEVLYVLAILGVLLLFAWWLLNHWYVKARNAAQSARRAALLLGGLNEPLSATEIQSLRERFTVTADEARAQEKADYYATQRQPGPARLAEMLEESAFYSQRLQRTSANVMLFVLLLFVVVFVLIALAATPWLERDTLFLVVRVFLAMMVFAMSADVLGAWRLHSDAAREIKEVRARLMKADGAGYPMPDVLMAFADYNAAVEAAPESVPYAYKWRQKALEEDWATYLADRGNARAAR